MGQEEGLDAKLRRLLEQEVAKDKAAWPMFMQNPQRTGFIDLTKGGDGNYLVVCGCYDGNVYGLDFFGKKEWEFNTGGKDGSKFVNSSAAIVEDLIVVGADTGNLHGLSFEGKELWRYETEDDVRSSPVITGNLVVLLSDG